MLIKTSSSGAGVLIGAALARLLTLEMMGVYFVALQLIRVSSVIVRLGVPTNLMRLLAVSVDRQAWSQAKGYLGAAGQILIVSFFLLTIVYGLSWSHLVTALNISALQNLFWLLAACVAVRVIEEAGSAVLKGLHQIKLGVGLLDSPRQLMFLVMIGALLYWHGKQTIASVFVVYAMATLPAVIWSAIAVTKSLHKNSCNRDRIDRLALLKSSAPYFGMNLLSILMASIPFWIASAFVGTEEAGLYGAAVQVSIVISFFLGIANQITPASLAALYARGDKIKLENLLQTTAGWGLMIATPALLLILMFGQEMLTIIFGQAYGKSYGPLAFLAIAQYVNAAAGSPGLLLQMSGRQVAVLIITFSWVVVNIGMGIALALWAGIHGVAVANCIAVVGLNITLVLYVRLKMSLRTYARINMHFLNSQGSRGTADRA